MGYNSRHPGTTANYRIDRMDRVEVIEDSTLSEEALARIDGGEREAVCSASISSSSAPFSTSSARTHR